MTEISYSKCVKIRLKAILKDCVNYDKFFDVVHRSNQLYFIGSHFIRSYVLYLFNRGESLPKLDADFIRMAFKAISKKSRGPKPGEAQANTLKPSTNIFIFSRRSRRIQNSR